MPHMVDDAKWVQAQEERDLKLPRELQRAEERRAKMERGRARTMAARGQPARIDPARLQIRATAVQCEALDRADGGHSFSFVPSRGRFVRSSRACTGSQACASTSSFSTKSVSARRPTHATFQLRQAHPGASPRVTPHDTAHPLSQHEPNTPVQVQGEATPCCCSAPHGFRSFSLLTYTDQGASHAIP